MPLHAEQLVELKQHFPQLQCFEEGQQGYVFFPEFLLPTGTTPAKCDLLLCPHARDGYPSRLFFSMQVARSPTARTKDVINWNGQVRLIERNWHAFSWKFADGTYTLTQLLTLHLGALQ